ncbi:MAG: hypothetical protein HY662_05035 [Chloroflexi bacterium]|nr:hypothetical protein [Chloroflexota bacterium]
MIGDFYTSKFVDTVIPAQAGIYFYMDSSFRWNDDGENTGVIEEKDFLRVLMEEVERL